MTELTLQHKQQLGAVRRTVDERSFRDDIVPPEVTDVIRDFAAELSPEPPVYVPRLTDSHAVYGWPADGVRDKIRTNGGGIRFGWRLREWPRVLLSAEFHAVWVDPDGTLVDITPQVAYGERTLFVPHPSYPETVDPDPPPLARHRVLHVRADHSKAIAERIARLKTGQRAYEERRAQKAGKTLEEWFDDKLFPDLLPVAIAAFIEASDDFDAKLPTLANLIEARPAPPDEPPMPPPATDDAGGDSPATPAGSATAGADLPEESAPAAPAPADASVDAPADDTVPATPATTPDSEMAEDDDWDSADEDTWDDTWNAVDSIYEWTDRRETRREAILLLLPGT